MPVKGPLYRVLLLDGDTRQSLPVARALRKRGHRVTVACESWVSYGAWSRYPHQRVSMPSCSREPEAYLESLFSYLEAEPHEVTIPLFDHTADLTSRHKAELSRLTRVPVPDYSIFRLARDKSETMRLCRELGVPHPRTLDPTQVPLEQIASQMDFPCIVKPNVSHGALGIRPVESSETLEGVYQDVALEFGPCCVQELIPEGGMQYKVQIFRGRDGRIAAAVAFDKLRYFPVTGGTSSLNSTVDRPAIVAQCLRLLEGMQWESHADVDLIEDPRDGALKVMEVNPRITGSIKIAFEAGVDFADLLVRHALGEALPVYNSYRVALYMRYMPLDLLWFLYSPARFRAEPSWFRFLSRDLCYQEGSWDDPLPALAGFLSGVIKFASPSFRRKKLGKRATQSFPGQDETPC